MTGNRAFPGARGRSLRVRTESAEALLTDLADIRFSQDRAASKAIWSRRGPSADRALQ